MKMSNAFPSQSRGGTLQPRPRAGQSLDVTLFASMVITTGTLVLSGRVNDRKSHVYVSRICSRHIRLVLEQEKR